MNPPPSRFRFCETWSNCEISRPFQSEFGKDVTIEALEEEFDAVFLAPGLWSGRTLEIAGQERIQVTDALDFLTTFRETSKVEVGKNVLAIGGGSVASDAAMTAKHAGAEVGRTGASGDRSGRRMESIDHASSWGKRS